MSDDIFRFNADNIRQTIEGALNGAGILCRVFARGKSVDSINKKLSSGEYSVGGKLLQDAVGVRIVLYFQEDTGIVAGILKSRFEEVPDASSIDEPKKDKFTVSRYNLVFKYDLNDQDDYNLNVAGRPIDITFEVQLRSVLSEGWHEVEHDLRYKCKDFWEGHDDLSRMLNGIMATLETSEWSMKSIFDDLSYRNYKEKKWVPMLLNKLRLRAAPTISPGLLEVLDRDLIVAKAMYRMSRDLIIRVFAAERAIRPSLDNAIYIWNLYKRCSAEIESITPDIISKSFRSWASTNLTDVVENSLTE